MDKTKTGLYRKFDVRRTDGSDAPGQKHDGCAYFVLDLTHDEHAVAAIRAYARSCATEFPMLAADLRSWADGNKLMEARTMLTVEGKSTDCSTPPRETPQAPRVLELARALVTQWRDEATRYSDKYPSALFALKKCADELEAVLVCAGGAQPSNLTELRRKFLIERSSLSDEDRESVLSLLEQFEAGGAQAPAQPETGEASK